MSEQYYTTAQIAQRLKCSPRTVTGWIVAGKLPGSKKVNGKWQVPEKSLKNFLENTRESDTQAQRTPWLGTAAISRVPISRRSLLKTLGAGAALLIAEELVGPLLRRTSVADRIEGAFEAPDVFKQLFGHIDPRHQFSVGERIYAGGFHRDNVAAGKALLGPLGIVDDSKQLAVDWSMEVDLRGDHVVIGGPISTLLTRIAWEFDGSTPRTLRRPEKPIVPLRWYGIPDVTDQEIAGDYRIGWRMEGIARPVITANWLFEDTESPKRRRPEPDWQKEKIIVDGQEAYLPKDNYLLITRMPNFLDPDFGEKLRLDPCMWPHLLVFQGNHGVGTRAAELLLSYAGLTALKEAARDLDEATEFQILFRVHKLGLAGEAFHTFHKFHAIELVDVWSLDFLLDDKGSKVYQRAHEHATAVIELLSRT